MQGPDPASGPAESLPECSTAWQAAGAVDCAAQQQYSLPPSSESEAEWVLQQVQQYLQQLGEDEAAYANLLSFGPDAHADFKKYMCLPERGSGFTPQLIRVVEGLRRTGRAKRKLPLAAGNTPQAGGAASQVASLSALCAAAFVKKLGLDPAEVYTQAQIGPLQAAVDAYCSPGIVAPELHAALRDVGVSKRRYTSYSQLVATRSAFLQPRPLPDDHPPGTLRDSKSNLPIYPVERWPAVVQQAHTQWLEECAASGKPAPARRAVSAAVHDRVKKLACTNQRRGGITETAVRALLVDMPSTAPAESPIDWRIPPGQAHVQLFCRVPAARRTSSDIHLSLVLEGTADPLPMALDPFSAQLAGQAADAGDLVFSALLHCLPLGGDEFRSYHYQLQTEKSPRLLLPDKPRMYVTDVFFEEHSAVRPTGGIDASFIRPPYAQDRLRHPGVASHFLYPANQLAGGQAAAAGSPPDAATDNSGGGSNGGSGCGNSDGGEGSGGSEDGGPNGSGCGSSSGAGEPCAGQRRKSEREAWLPEEVPNRLRRIEEAECMALAGPYKAAHHRNTIVYRCSRSGRAATYIYHHLPPNHLRRQQRQSKQTRCKFEVWLKYPPGQLPQRDPLFGKDVSGYASVNSKAADRGSPSAGDGAAGGDSQRGAGSDSCSTDDSSDSSDASHSDGEDSTSGSEAESEEDGRAAQQLVAVRILGGHRGHQPGTPADRQLLPLALVVLQRAELLLGLKLPPAQVDIHLSGLAAKGAFEGVPPIQRDYMELRELRELQTLQARLARAARNSPDGWKDMMEWIEAQAANPDVIVRWVEYAPGQGFKVLILHKIQLEWLCVEPLKVLYLDSTHNTNSYGMQLFTLARSYETGQAVMTVPVAFFLCTVEQSRQIAVQWLLEQLNALLQERAQRPLVPAAVMMDKDQSEHNAWAAFLVQQALECAQRQLCKLRQLRPDQMPLPRQHSGIQNHPPACPGTYSAPPAAAGAADCRLAQPPPQPPAADCSAIPPGAALATSPTGPPQPLPTSHPRSPATGRPPACDLPLPPTAPAPQAALSSGGQQPSQLASSASPLPGQRLPACTQQSGARVRYSGAAADAAPYVDAWDVHRQRMQAAQVGAVARADLQAPDLPSPAAEAYHALIVTDAEALVAALALLHACFQRYEQQGKGWHAFQALARSFIARHSGCSELEELCSTYLAPRKLLCEFHSKKAWTDWLHRYIKPPEVAQDIYSEFVRMMHKPTWAQLLEAACAFVAQWAPVQPAAVSYLLENWLCVEWRSGWVLAGRKVDLDNVHTNLSLEGIFRILKYVLLRGVVNQRPADLLTALVGSAQRPHTFACSAVAYYDRRVQEAQRLRYARRRAVSACGLVGRLLAQQRSNPGMLQLVNPEFDIFDLSVDLDSDGEVAVVPADSAHAEAQAVATVTFCVCPAASFCDCPAETETCGHIAFVRLSRASAGRQIASVPLHAGPQQVPVGDEEAQRQHVRHEDTIQSCLQALSELDLAELPLGRKAQLARALQTAVDSVGLGGSQPSLQHRRRSQAQRQARHHGKQALRPGAAPKKKGFQKRLEKNKKVTTLMKYNSQKRKQRT